MKMTISKKAILLLASQLIALILIGAIVFSARQPAQAATLNDFSQIQWTDLGVAAQFPMGSGVSEAQAITVNGKIYVFGGYAPCCTPTRRMYVFDPATNAWTRLADLTKGLTHGGTTTDGVDIYYAGGYVENASQTGQVFGSKEVWRYNIATNDFTALPPLPRRASTGHMAYVAGKLHYLGNTTPHSRVDDLPDHFVFDLDAWKANPTGVVWQDFTANSPLPNPRQHASIAVVDGMIYYLGGQHNHDGELDPQNDVHRYNPQTDTWTQMADMPDLGRNHAGNSTVVLGGRIIVMAGQKWSGIFKSDVFAFDPAANTWTSLTPLPMLQHSAIGGVVNGVLYFGMGGSNNGANDRRAVRKGVPVLEDVTNTPQPTDTASPTPSPTDTPDAGSTATMTSTPENGVTETPFPATSTATNGGNATNTPQGTQAATATNTPGTPIPVTATATATATATGTGTQATAAVTATSTSTPIVGNELIVNGGFETDLNNDKLPDSWTPRFITGDSIKCNKPATNGKPEKIVAAAGNCAFQFRGGVNENARLQQTVIGGVYAAGDTLVLSAQINAKTGAVGKIQAKVKYNDVAAKTKLTLTFVPTNGYQLFADSALLTSGDVKSVKVQIRHSSPSGKVRVDSVSLVQQTVSAAGAPDVIALPGQ